MGRRPAVWQHAAIAMEPEDDITSQILNSLGALSAEEQTQVMLEVISAALKPMSIYRILEVRGEIAAELNPAIPLVTATLDLIDGQVALRSIAGHLHWR